MLTIFSFFLIINLDESPHLFIDSDTNSKIPNFMTCIAKKPWHLIHAKNNLQHK